MVRRSTRCFSESGLGGLDIDSVVMDTDGHARCVESLVEDVALPHAARDCHGLHNTSWISSATLEPLTMSALSKLSSNNQHPFQSRFVFEMRWSDQLRVPPFSAKCWGAC